MAEGAFFMLKQALRLGVVQKDGLLVGNNELHPAQRVTGAADLAQGGTTMRRAREAVGRDGGSIATAVIHYPIAALVHCLRVVARLRQQLGEQDAARHGPGGIEHHVGNPAAQIRGAAAGLAYHRLHMQCDMSLFDQLQLIGGHIDQHVAIAAGR